MRVRRAIGSRAPHHDSLLGGLNDLAALEAAGADVGAQRGTVGDDADLLQVRIEPARGGAHGMTAVIPEARALSAHTADLRHQTPSSGHRRVFNDAQPDFSGVPQRAIMQAVGG